jgi:hypothetical protein
MANGLLGFEETTVVSMRAQNLIVDQMPSLSKVKQAAR